MADVTLTLSLLLRDDDDGEVGPRVDRLRVSRVDLSAARSELLVVPPLGLATLSLGEQKNIRLLYAYLDGAVVFLPNQDPQAFDPLDQTKGVAFSSTGVKGQPGYVPAVVLLQGLLLGATPPYSITFYNPDPVAPATLRLALASIPDADLEGVWGNGFPFWDNVGDGGPPGPGGATRFLTAFDAVASLPPAPLVTEEALVINTSSDADDGRWIFILGDRWHHFEVGSDAGPHGEGAGIADNTAAWDSVLREPGMPRWTAAHVYGANALIAAAGNVWRTAAGLTAGAVAPAALSSSTPPGTVADNGGTWTRVPSWPVSTPVAAGVDWCFNEGIIYVCSQSGTTAVNQGGGGGGGGPNVVGSSGVFRFASNQLDGNGNGLANFLSSSNNGLSDGQLALAQEVGNPFIVQLYVMVGGALAVSPAPGQNSDELRLFGMAGATAGASQDAGNGGPFSDAAGYGGLGATAPHHNGGRGGRRTVSGGAGGQAANGGTHGDGGGLDLQGGGAGTGGGGSGGSPGDVFIGRDRFLTRRVQLGAPGNPQVGLAGVLAQLRGSLWLDEAILNVGDGSPNMTLPGGAFVSLDSSGADVSLTGNPSLLPADDPNDGHSLRLLVLTVVFGPGSVTLTDGVGGFSLNAPTRVLAQGRYLLLLGRGGNWAEVASSPGT